LVSQRHISPLSNVSWIRSQANTWDFLRLTLLALLIFIVTALASIPGAYDRGSAVLKLAMILGAVALFCVIIALGETFASGIIPTLALLGLGLAVTYLLVHDWIAQPVDFGFIDRLAVMWVGLRPGWFLPDVGDGWTHQAGSLLNRWLGQNVAGGLLAVFLPFSAVWIHQAWSGSVRRALPLAVAVVSFVVSVFGLILSSSRAAVLSLSGAVTMWALWRLGNMLPQPLRGRHRSALVLIHLLLLALIAAALANTETIIAILDRTPGFPSVASRLQISTDSLRLAADFPLLGGGLHAFPGLYSAYMEAIPHFLYGYGHNLYLDLAIEQGIFGLLAILAVYALSVIAGLKAGQAGSSLLCRQLAQVTMVGQITLLLHGLMDDPFYGESGTPFLLILPACSVVALRLSQKVQPLPPLTREARTRFGRRGWAAVSITLVFFTGIWGRSVVSLAFSNLAAVKMAQVQLADFPSGVWPEKMAPSAMDPIEAMLKRSIAWSPENRTANQRLGLIAMLRWDFQAACPYLFKAYQMDPGHRGVVKNLGYCLAWTGQFREAQQYLQRIPEAPQELGNYSFWWLEHDQLDLAANALKMQAILTGEVKL